MSNTSIFDKSMIQLLEEQTQIRPIPDKEIEISDSMTDKEIEEFILAHSKKQHLKN